MASEQRYVLVIDDHNIIAQGCQYQFTQAGLPWTVQWVPSLHTAEGLPVPELGAVDGRPVPDLAILELRLEDGSTPTDNVRELNELSVPVIIYTSGDERVLVREAIAAGVLAIVRKSAPDGELIDAATAALDGIPSAGLDWASALDTDGDFVAEHLAPSEVRILSLYAMGAKSVTVARELGCTVPTVNTCMARIREKYRKVGRPADTRVDLFLRAAEDGLVGYRVA